MLQKGVDKRVAVRSRGRLDARAKSRGRRIGVYRAETLRKKKGREKNEKMRQGRVRSNTSRWVIRERRDENGNARLYAGKRMFRSGRFVTAKSERACSAWINRLTRTRRSLD